jgi:hypothetical protein
MSAQVSIFRAKFLAMTAALAIGVAGSTVAAPVGGGHAVGGGQYEAVQPPSGVGGTAPSNSSGAQNYATGNGGWTDLFAYPKAGQSPEQQARDREECRTWAISQTGFDPSKPTQDNQKDYAAKRDGYLRAEAACLQARNYSVK